MASIFEKTMQACRDAKTLKEKKSVSTSKKLTEKKVSSKRLKKESDDQDLEMDFADDIVAVIDPDIEADEMTSVAAGFQQLIDDTPDNEIPETDEYLDDHIYGCPICGAKFFSEEPMADGDTCPVCGETANGFVMVGEVDSAESTEGKEETSDEDEEKFDIDGDKIEVDVDDEKEVEESKRVRRAARESSRVRRPGRRIARSEGRRIARRGVRKESLKIDDLSFNRYLSKFIRENYANASSFKVVKARKVGPNLKFECNITFKSGKTKKAILNCKYNRGSKIMLARDTGAFKAESKKAPFMFKVRTVGNVIKCEGMRYDFVTSQKSESGVKAESKTRVHGSYMAESRRATRRPTTRRVAESRRSVRKPMARRTVESRRVTSRRVRPTVARRTMESRRAIRRPSRRVESRRAVATRRRIARPMGEARRVARPTTRRAVRSESSRVARRPMVRKSVRSESVRRVARKPVARSVRAEGTRRAIRRPARSMRSEARRNVSTRRVVRK